MSVTSVITFDKENKQDNYRFIARDMSGKLVIGWIVVEKPWYSPESAWTYWMYFNEYGGCGICGGASDLGLKRTQVNPETIKPYNQIEKIKYDLENGFKIKLLNKYYFNKDEEPDDNVLAIINNTDEIPYELWIEK